MTKGIDISSWQSTLDLSKIKTDFIIAKISEGRTWVDPKFEKFYSDAKVPIGAYVYSYATTEDVARQEARFALSLIKGRPLPLGIYMDVEDPSQLRLSDSGLTAVVKAFCDEIRAGGYIPGAYGSAGNLWAKVGPSYLGNDVIVWSASWGLQPKHTHDIWQYSSSEHLSGYDGNLDGDQAMSARFLALLNSTPTPAPEPTPEPEPEEDKCIVTATLPILKKGDRNLHVKVMQTLLIGKGFSCGWMGADGDFGNATHKALLSFQQTQSLSQDGVCSRLTWQALLKK